MKSNDETRCRQLLDAFYQGIISPEEQAELRLLLKAPDLPADLEEERAFFDMLGEGAHQAAADLEMFDAMASDMVGRLAAEERRAHRRAWRRGGLWAAAAAVAAVLAVGAVMRFDSAPDSVATPLVAEATQPSLQVRPTAPQESPEARNKMVAVAEKPGVAPRKPAEAAAPAVAAPAAAPAGRVADEVTDEELRLANETIDEVQAFFNELMAEWDNADRGVRGLLKNPGTLADSGERDPEIIENQ